jgi:hypothetical protein
MLSIQNTWKGIDVYVPVLIVIEVNRVIIWEMMTDTTKVRRKQSLVVEDWIEGTWGI